MSQTTERIHELVEKLNRYRHEYYNEDAPSVSDAVYDHLYDELARAEKETGIILSNSPTQTVGYKAVSSLEKVRHHIPLLSLDKTKLETILGISIREISMPARQGTATTPYGEKGMRFHAYINDDMETVYNMEMECRNQKKAFLPKKARYYEESMDLDIISAGEDCGKLKKSFVIFVCTFDPFSDGRHIYTFENRCKEYPSLALGDGATKIFLNTKGTINDIDQEMLDLLSYMENTTDAFAAQAASPLVREIHKRVTEIKQNKDMANEYANLAISLCESNRKQRGYHGRRKIIPEQGRSHPEPVK